jgi:serine/threonine protein phosphatase PrpC
MTRTLGDIAAKKVGLLSDPEIFHIEMRPGDRFIVIASDGVWDVMKSAEVVGYILKHPDRETAAEGLVKEARGRWVKYNQQKRWRNNISDYVTARTGIDDITVVIAYMKYKIDNDEYKNLQLNAHGKIVYV